MSSEKKVPSGLAAIIQEVKSERLLEGRRKGGQIRGAKRKLESVKKAIRIFEAEIKILEQYGEQIPERGMNKRIARITGYPPEYVMKVRREHK
jgi:hypothetical protein